MVYSNAELRARYAAAHPERVRASNATYAKSEKGRTSRATYAKSEKGRVAQARAEARYKATTAGILAGERSYQKRQRGEPNAEQD